MQPARLVVYKRPVICIAIGVASGVLCWGIVHHLGLGAADFNYALQESRELLHGRNPYGPFSKEASYPLPAAILALPFVPFKPDVSAGLFFGLSTTLLAFGLTRDGYTRLLVLFAYPYWAAMLWVQWAPLVMASALLPWLIPVSTAKPQLGAPILFTRLGKQAVILCALFVFTSLIIMPTWPAQWLSGVGYHPQYTPLLVSLGPALLLALYRNRDEGSHLLLLSAVCPQHWFYDALILWLIPKSRAEIVSTVALSWGVGIYRWHQIPHSWNEAGAWVVLWIYIPMLTVILLRSREDSGLAGQNLHVYRMQNHS